MHFAFGDETKFSFLQNLPIQNKGAHISDCNNVTTQEERDTITSLARPKPSVDMMVKTFHVKNASQGDVPFSGPLQISGSSGFAWAKRRFDDSSVRSRRRTSSRSLIFEPSIALHVKNNMEPKGQDNYELIDAKQTNYMDQDTYESTKHAIRQSWSQLERPDSFDASDGYHSQELSLTQYLKEETAIKRINLVSQKLLSRVLFNKHIFPHQFICIAHNKIYQFFCTGSFRYNN